ncbi:hypothetical protein SLA2020_481520 [Shorea laevis]
MLQLIMKVKDVGAFLNPNKTKKHRRAAKEEKTETQHITTRVCMKDHVATQSLIEMGCTKDKAKRLIALALECCDENTNQRPDINKMLQE